MKPIPRRAPAQASLPDPNAPGSASIYDGARLAGTIVEQDGKHYAFDATGKLIGAYASRAEAMRAIPSGRRA